MNNPETEKIINLIFDAAKEVHRHLGTGLIKSAYKATLCYEMHERGLHVETEVNVHLKYKNKILKEFLTGEIIINKKIIIEILSSTKEKDFHQKKLSTLLRFSDATDGLLINFNVPQIAGGFHKYKV
ncbi:MAG: GxxExxY protein [Bacteroidales bacterium]